MIKKKHKRSIKGPARPGSRIVVGNIGPAHIVLHELAEQMTTVAYLNTIQIVQRELFPLVILTGDI